MVILLYIIIRYEPKIFFLVIKKSQIMYFSFSAIFNVKVIVNDCHLLQTLLNTNLTKTKISLFVAILLCHSCSGVTRREGGNI